MKLHEGKLLLQAKELYRHPCEKQRQNCALYPSLIAYLCSEVKGKPKDTLKIWNYGNYQTAVRRVEGTELFQLIGLHCRPVRDVYGTAC